MNQNWWVESMVERLRRKMDDVEAQLVAVWAAFALSIFLTFVMFLLSGCTSGFDAGSGYRIDNLKIKNCEQVRGAPVCSGGMRV